MKKFVFAFLLLPFFSLSQDKNSQVDSLRFYSQQLSNLRKQTIDSLIASKAYKDALAGLERQRKKSNNYVGFVLLSGLIHSNFQAFNQSLVQNGFTPFNSVLPQYGVGISNKTSTTMFDFYFGIASGSASSTKGDEKVSFSIFNTLQFDLGVDLLKSRVVSLYPYAGLSLRSTMLQYDKPVQLNSSFTNISNMITNNQSVQVSSQRLGYQAGLGFDIVLAENKKHTTNKVLFIKGGMNRPVWKDKYSFHGLTYDPHIKSGDWGISVGIKFGNKN